MEGFTGEEVEQQVREAVERTERSFGSTFKRMKSENEELQARLDEALRELDEARDGYESRVATLEEENAERGRRVRDLAIRAEVERRLREDGPLPERFIDLDGIGYADDPEELRANVAEALERGRAELDAVLRDLGVETGMQRPSGNPATPPARDVLAARALRSHEAREALADMGRRGLIR